MLSRQDLGRLLEYTVWANHRIMRAAATLEVEDFKRDLQASYGGVRGTLTHIMGAEWIWLERWKGLSPARLLDEGEFPDILALRERWRVIEEHREAWFRSLGDDAPGRIIAYRNLAGVADEAPLWQLVQHVANHSSYHRGQVTTMLRQLGAKTVSTDMVAWDRERRAKEAERER
jgi:uncharacterized damage-inducible protein DinB